MSTPEATFESSGGRPPRSAPGVATRPGPRARPLWWTLVPSALLVLVVLFILATKWSAIVASQHAYLSTLVVVGLLGLLGVAFSLLSPTGSDPRPRSSWWTWTRRGLGIVAVLLLAGILLWLRPLPATELAVHSMDGTSLVRVSTTSSTIELQPTKTAKQTGFIFFPGALVDPRAYVPLLTKVADQGYLVEIIKAPFNIAFLSSNAPAGIIADHPSISRWVLGGHSLGGVAAASFASTKRPKVEGLVLWASYPSSSMADARWLTISSISASNDGLATPAKIEASKPDLPPSTTYVVVEGAVHADFGDYGAQRGDGTPTITRQQAQAQIEAATIALLDRVDRG